jgi:hypothetical protein
VYIVCSVCGAITALWQTHVDWHVALGDAAPTNANAEALEPKPEEPKPEEAKPEEPLSGKA